MSKIYSIDGNDFVFETPHDAIAHVFGVHGRTEERHMTIYEATVDDCGAFSHVRPFIVRVDANPTLRHDF